MMPCFIGLQPSEESLTYLAQRMTANYVLLKSMGWPVRLVPPRKWHVTILWFEYLSRKERTILWSRALAEVEQGTWNNLDLEWQGLDVWHSWKEPRLVAMTAKKIRAVKKWGLESWLTDPVCSKGLLNRLKSYQPHITMVRFLEKELGPPGCRDWKKEWEHIQPQLQSIDPTQVYLDRVTLYLSDFSQKPHRYIYEHVVNITPGKRSGRSTPCERQLKFDFEE